MMFWYVLPAGRTLYVGGHGNLASTVSILDRVGAHDDNSTAGTCSDSEIVHLYDIRMGLLNKKNERIVKKIWCFTLGKVETRSYVRIKM